MVSKGREDFRARADTWTGLPGMGTCKGVQELSRCRDALLGQVSRPSRRSPGWGRVELALGLTIARTPDDHRPPAEMAARGALWAM